MIIDLQSYFKKLNVELRATLFQRIEDLTVAHLLLTVALPHACGGSSFVV